MRYINPRLTLTLTLTLFRDDMYKFFCLQNKVRVDVNGCICACLLIVMIMMVVVAVVLLLLLLLMIQTCQHWEISKRACPRAKSWQLGQGLKDHRLRPEDQGRMPRSCWKGTQASSLGRESINFLLFWSLEKASFEENGSA